MSPRRRAVPTLALLLVGALTPGCSLGRGSVDACAGVASMHPSGTPLTSGSRLRTELDGDARLRRLSDALGSLGQPFGPVAAAVGYDYDRYLTLGAVGDGVAVWSRRTPTWQLLDPTTLRPRWGASIPRAGMSWDTVGDDFVAVRAGEHPSVTTYDEGSGRQHWCVPLPGPVRNDQVATAGLDDGDLLVAQRHDGATRLARLRGHDGRTRWSVQDPTPGDTVGDLGGGRLVVGGVSEAALYDDAVGRTGTTTIVGRDARTGRRVWSATTTQPEEDHVVGTVPDAGLFVVQSVAGGATTLSARDRDGRVAWSLPPSAGPAQAALRGSVLLVRAADARGRARLSAYDVGSGRPLWRWRLRAVPQLFPYGFELSSAPSLDDDHVLLPTTDALVSVDLRSGARTSYALPTDGINTTYWPYQLVVTDRLVGVVTNTGAVVLRRTD